MSNAIGSSFLNYLKENSSHYNTRYSTVAFGNGPNGQIKKIVRFTRIEVETGTFYNLGFGDWNVNGKRIDDFIVSDNKDAEKVLATIASLVLAFTNTYPDAIIYAEGSTASRTRRYQMGISKYWGEIDPLFNVLGLIQGQGFEEFNKGKNYAAFVVRRKK